MAQPTLAWRLGMAGLAVIAIARGVRTILDHPYVTPELLRIADHHLPASAIVGAAWIASAVGLVLHGIIRPGVPPRLYRLSLYLFVFLAGSMALAYLLSLPLQGHDADLWLWIAVHVGSTLLAMHMIMTRRRV